MCQSFIVLNGLILKVKKCLELLLKYVITLSTMIDYIRLYILSSRSPNCRYKQIAEKPRKRKYICRYSFPFNVSLLLSLHLSISIFLPVRPDSFLLYFAGKVSNGVDRFVFPKRLLTPVYCSFKTFTGPFLQGTHIQRGWNVQKVLSI